VRRSLLERVTMSAINGLYIAAFQWWLEPLLTLQAERNLRADVRRELPFLFDAFDTHFVANEREYRWGKVVMLAARNLKLRVSKDRGEYGVTLSTMGERSEWAGVRDVLTIVTPEYGLPPFDPIVLSEWSKLLKAQFARLEEAYRPEQYSVIRQKLEQTKANAIAKMKAEVATQYTDRAIRNNNLNS